MFLNCCRLLSSIKRSSVELRNLGLNGYTRNCSSFGSLKSSTSNTNNQTPGHAAAKAHMPTIKKQIRRNKLSHHDSYGQPTYLTHSHLLKEGELTPGILPTEYSDRRHRLAENIQRYAISLDQNLKNHIIIVPSAAKKFMSDKIPYVFRQNTDFFYLSGCLEPDSVLAITIDSNGSSQSVLFMRPKNKQAELWDGARTGDVNAPDVFGVDEAYPVHDLKTFISKFIRLNPSFTVWYDKKNSDQRSVTDAVESCLQQTKPSTSESPTLFIHKLRVIKSAAEQNLMRKTCQIASEAINDTIRESKVGDSEHHIFARVDYYCRMRNANYLAYPPVVAAGENATTIHYVNNTQLINSGDFVLMDAGCEYGGYTSDITRTWPISGSFSSTQIVLYEVLLTVQKELLGTLMKEGGRTLDELFDTMCIKLGIYLQEIGIIPKNLTCVDLAKVAYSFCPHHVSHYLGMDVHDTPLISRNSPLIPGMVCTVEPGIYISADRKDVPAEFRGVGLRIEDDVLITSDCSVEVLTEKCVKDTKKIESLIKS